MTGTEAIERACIFLSWFSLAFVYVNISGQMVSDGWPLDASLTLAATAELS